ncbi:hypothetical protein LUZ60_001073 [Juncus effusus]|nr:hypothetical protein LUZ60_001073 [Juncus effusus]
MVMEVRARASGKVILSGEHAVVHGSSAVAASIDLYTHVRLLIPPPSSSGSENDQLEIELNDMNLTFTWPISQLKQILGENHAINIFQPKPCSCEKLDLISRLVAEKKIPESKIQIGSGISAFLFLYTSIQGFKPLKAVVTSELPLGSGLGSSAAFCVSISGALIALNAQSFNENRQKDSWLSFEKKELELVNNWAFEGEKIIHGKPSGIDNTVSTFGNMIKFKKGEITKLNSSSPIKMLVTDTKVGRNTKALVSSVSLKTLRHPFAMQSIFNAIDSLSNELAEIVEAPAGDELAISEKEEKLKEIMGMNQGLLRCIGVSHESIETVVRITESEKSGNGKLVSKLTGAGGGGCVLTLIPTLLSDTAIQKVISELELHGFRCFMVQVGGKGLEVCYS